LFEQPLLLWLLLLSPLVVLPGWLNRAAPRSWAQITATVLRLACFVVLVVALAGPTTQTLTRAHRLTIIALLDRSRSIAPDQSRWMEDRVTELRSALGPHDQLEVMGFGRDAQLINHATGAPNAPIDRGGTDIAAALGAAASVFPPSNQKKLLLLSDGNQTQGSASDELPELVDQGVQVYTAAPPPSQRQRIAIDSLDAPNPIRAHLSFALQLAIDSDVPTPLDAQITLSHEKTVVGSYPIRLTPGLNRYEIPMHLDQPGAHLLTVRLSAPAGLEVVNPSAEMVASVVPPPRVLIASADVPVSLTTALKLRDYAVDETTPERLPTNAEDYLAYQAVIVDDASAKSLPVAAQTALSHYVADFGGGLIVTGSALRDQGFKNSLLEKTLPIKFMPQPPPPSRAPMGVYLCIDRSNSMSYNSRYPSIRDGERIRYAKEAAIALLNQLDDSDYVGVIAFDSQPYVLSRLHRVGNDRIGLIQKIMRLEPGGGTDFLEAMQIAAGDLIQSGLPVRQIILLTDGDTNRQYHDHDQLMYDLAQQHLPVSTVRIGPDLENLRLLQDFAEMTGGTFYRVDDIEKLPQLFIRLSRQAIASQHQTKIKEDATSPILKGIPAQQVPALDFYSATQPKPDASVPLSIQRGDQTTPLLVAWQYGLGRSAIVAADPDSLTTVPWTQWDHYAQLWSQIVSWTMRQGESGAMDLKVIHNDDGSVRIQAQGATTNSASNLVCRIAGPKGSKLEVPMTPRADNQYRADAITLPPGKYTATLWRKTGDKEQMLTSIGFGVAANQAPDLDELRLRPPNLNLLRRLALGTSGAYGASAQTLLKVTGREVPVTRPLTPLLIPVIILLLLAEVFVRRCLT
jgi:Ca-activated chloride channel family protein